MKEKICQARPAGKPPDKPPPEKDNMTQIAEKKKKNLQSNHPEIYVLTEQKGDSRVLWQEVGRAGDMAGVRGCRRDL